MPGLSIILPFFNAEKYLAASIESICTQTFSDWEFLIVDDASTDSSLAIAAFLCTSVETGDSVCCLGCVVVVVDLG